MTFPAEVADKLISAAATKGIDAPALFTAAGINRCDTLHYAELCALYEAAACLTDDAAFGLHVGERTRAENYGLLGYAAAHSFSLGQSLERLVALQGVWTQAVAFELRSRGGRATLRYRDREGVAPSRRRQECEQMMAAVLAFVRAGTGEDLRPLEVRFEHKAPDETGEHQRVFRCPLLFGASATEIILTREALSAPILHSDPTLGALMQRQAENVLAGSRRREPLLDAVRLQVESALETGATPSLDEVARRLAMGPRTLQRRLQEKGWTWRALCEGERIRVAKDLLADPRVSLAQIAFRVGFSEASAFHRAFRRVEKITPGDFRKRVSAAQERR